MRALLFLLLFIACNTADTTDQTCKIVSIADGDTFTILTATNQQVKVRLHGIDCPEKAQPFGTVARQGLSKLIFGKRVRIEKKDTDRYGRIVAVVFTNDGVNINEQLLREGLAWHYKQYDNNAHWDDLMQEAQRKKQGYGQIQIRHRRGFGVRISGELQNRKWSCFDLQ